MRDRAGVLIGLVAGAVAGSVAGWLFLTDDGKRFRADLQPRLDELADGAVRLRDSAARVRDVARDGFRTLQEVAARTPGR
jgi:gas vesicle protein